jgi:hypothetical protein
VDSPGWLELVPGGVRGSCLAIMQFVRKTKSEAAAAAGIGACLGARRREELLVALRPCFARTEPWLQAAKAQIEDPVQSLLMGLPPDLVFRTKGQLAMDIAAEVLADSIAVDFLCGDEVYGSCTELRAFFEDRGQGYVLRVPKTFGLTLPSGQRLTCADAASLLAGTRRGEVRSAGKGSKGERWYAWSWLATASPRQWLLRRQPRLPVLRL